MRLACVFVPRFALAVEARLDSRLLRTPAIVYSGNRVLAASSELTGVYPGQPLRQARAVYPHAIFVPANPLLYREVSEAMFVALEQIGPYVELAEQGCAFVDVGGLDGHYADPFALAGKIVDVVRDATGLLPAVGVAEGKFVARVAAALCPPGDAGVVPPGRERDFLRDKSVSLLSAAPEVIEQLHMLALHTLGDHRRGGDAARSAHRRRRSLAAHAPHAPRARNRCRCPARPPCGAPRRAATVRGSQSRAGRRRRPSSTDRAC